MDEYTSPCWHRRPTPGASATSWSTTPSRRRTKVVFKRRAGDRWLDVTCSDFLTEVQAVAKGLIAAGVAARRPGRR